MLSSTEMWPLRSSADPSRTKLTPRGLTGSWSSWSVWTIKMWVPVLFLNPWQWEVVRREEEKQGLLQEEGLLCHFHLLRLFIWPICCIWFHCPHGSFLLKNYSKAIWHGGDECDWYVPIMKLTLFGCHAQNEPRSLMLFSQMEAPKQAKLAEKPFRKKYFFILWVHNKWGDIFCHHTVSCVTLLVRVRQNLQLLGGPAVWASRFGVGKWQMHTHGKLFRAGTTKSLCSVHPGGVNYCFRSHASSVSGKDLHLHALSLLSKRKSKKIIWPSGDDS